MYFCSGQLTHFVSGVDKGSFTQMSAADTEARQEALARLIAKSLKK
jgi:hypothetical protein